MGQEAGEAGGGEQRSSSGPSLIAVSQSIHILSIYENTYF